MDLSHELGALRFVVDSPLSSKVAMFNQHVNQHKQGQLLNPFANSDGRASPKPSFSKDEYGKPLAGSLTEARGQKANMHVLREMLELCQIIDSEGYNVKDEPTMRVIPFGELFNIYNYISDKCVGICLRARKHKLIEFEGEMLFQRRDDDVPIFLLRPILEIRQELQEKIEIIKRCGSASPQATTLLMDRKGLSAPKGATPNSSRTPSPQTSKASTPVREINTETPIIQASGAQTAEVVNKTEATKTEMQAQVEIPTKEETKESSTSTNINNKEQETTPQQTVAEVEAKLDEVPKSEPQQLVEPSAEITVVPTELKPDVNNNQKAPLPTIVIEASAVYEHPANEEPTKETEPNSAAPNAPSETEAAI